MLTNVTVKRRKSWFLAASALASSSLGISGPALAQCSAVDTSGNASCSAGTYTDTGAPGTFPAPISYNQATPNTPLNVTFDSGVNVTLSNPGIAVSATNFGGGAAAGAVLLTANGATISITSPAVGEHRGLSIETQANNATITASGQIDVAATSGSHQGSHAIKAIVLADFGPGDASVTYTGAGRLPFDLRSSGTNSTVIQAESLNGNAKIVASGNLSSFGNSNDMFFGLFAQTGGSVEGHAAANNPGDATVTYNSGTITIQGSNSTAIFAGVQASGSARITTLLGTTIIVSGNNPGDPLDPAIAADLNGTAADGREIRVDAASTIVMHGSRDPDSSLTNDPIGIRALSRSAADSAPIFVNYHGPGITTEGGQGFGILALARNGGGSGINSGGITVTSSGPITTSGAEALGIVADSGTIRNATQGAPSGPGGNIMVTASGAITTLGAGAHGIWAASTTGTVQVNAFSNVSTTGQFSTGINAISSGLPGAPGGNVAVNVAQGVSVNGGWQDTGVGASASTFFALPAAGVILSSNGGTATLTNDGSIGALSDRAVASSLLFPSNNTSITNNGSITGFVQLVGGNNSILNNGTFDLRHFADTTGGGRDTLRVAIADLGAGPGNTFTNNGTLALLGAPGAKTLDDKGQYLPLGLTFNAMALGGPVQGHILGAATFTNSGTINLQANPVPGDVLLISGGHTPGSNGAGTFISGGSLLIDTVLNAGGTASQSDVLVLDNAKVGAGATGISVHASGPGALTPGNGILVVQGLGTTAPGAFSLTGPVEAGAFSYLLFRGSVDASGPQNWYLRSTLTCSLTPDAPGCVTPPQPIPPTPTPPQPVIPNLRPAVPLYTALSPLAAQYGFSSLGTLHERMGDPYATVDPGGRAPAAPTAPALYLKAAPAAAPPTDFPAIWGRLLGEVGKRDNNNFLSAGPDYTWNFGGLQSGFDLWHREGHDGARDHAGVYGTVGSIGADVQRVFREFGSSAGTVSMQAVSFGGYWTHYGPTGWYVDAVTQGTWYDSDARSATGPALHTNGLGWAGSLEGGYPIALARHLVLEPQAQLIYQRVRFNDGNDGDALVSFDNSDALQGRLGARLVKTWDIGAPTLSRPLDTWLRANLWHEFLDGTDTTFAGLTGANAITFAAPLKGTWAEIGGGATGAIGPNTTLFATTAYQHNIDGNHQFAWTGRAGVTVRW